MLKFLFGIIFFVFILFLLVGIAGVRLLSKINGHKGQTRQDFHEKSSDSQAHANRKKIFDKDEGEYVDFEEIAKDE